MVSMAPWLSFTVHVWRVCAVYVVCVCVRCPWLLGCCSPCVPGVLVRCPFVHDVFVQCFGRVGVHGVHASLALVHRMHVACLCGV